MEKMKKLLTALRPLVNLWPALLVVLMLSLCSGALTPTLEAIPELLEQSAAAAETEQDSADEADSSAAADGSAEAEAVQLAAGVGNFTDGTFTGSARGYGGTVKVQVTVENSQITAVDILSASGETSSFFNRAKGVISSVLQAQTWDVDVVSGATYSSRGILGAIQNALTNETVENPAPAAVASPKKQSTVTFKDPDSYKDGTYYGSAQGFGGKVKVKVVISGGKISSVSVVSAGGETGSYLKKAKAVLSRIVKANSPNVDTVSGATYSSRGILNATKNALKSASGSNTTDDKKNETPETPADPAATWKDGTYTGTAEGFGGDVTVRVTISGGRITKIDVVSAEDETPTFFTRAKNILSTMLTKQTSEVDTVTGATYSSDGLKNAVASALKQAEDAANGKDDDKKDDQDSSNTDDDTPAEPDTPADPAATWKDGIYTATAEGYDGDITVCVTISDGRITKIDVVSAEDETPSYFKKAQAILDTILAGQTAEVDTISGATYSSTGLKNAVSDALKQAEDAANGKDDDKKDDQDSSDTDDDKKDDKGDTDTDEDKKDDKDDSDTDGDKKDDGSGNEDKKEDEKEDKSTYKDGTYKATAKCSDGDEEYGFCYDLTVSVTIEDDKITKIDVSLGSDQYYDGNDEDNDYYCGKAKKGVVKSILSKQSTDVDTVSGATYSSKAIKQAVSDALKQAKN